MINIRITLVKQHVNQPPTQTFDHTDINVVDAAGSSSTQVVNGKEATPWAATFSVADGAGAIKLTDKDTLDNPMGAPINIAFDTTKMPGGFFQTTGATVTLA
jgi:hypothetical protein